MTTLTELTSFFEDHFFAAYVKAANGFSVVLIALEQSNEVQLLITLLKQESSTREMLLTRMSKLLSTNPNPEYAHPLDEAITAYLYALSQVDENLAQQAATAVLATPRLWWANRMATHIQAQQPETMP